jgi:uncharacterized protein YceH (UPF0502 family)
VLEIGTSELVILAELMLRGPQTLGELKGRASRMHPLETTEIVKNVLDALMKRPEPMVQELPPAPGDRAPRYAQLLCPKLHPLDAPARPVMNDLGGGGGSSSDLVNRVQELEHQVSELKQTVARLSVAMGEPAAS